MPILPPTPTPVMRVRLQHGLGANLAIGSISYWAYTGGTPTIANLNTIAGLIATNWGTNLKSLMSSNGLLNRVDLLDLASSTGNQTLATASVAGTRVGNEVSMNTAVVVGFKIARRYRGGKPKAFLPYGVVADLGANENQWLAAFITAMNTGWTNFATGMSGLTGGTTVLGAQQNVSYHLGATNNPSGSKWARRNVPAVRAVPVLDPIIGVSTQAFLGTQRRRLSKP